MSARRRSYGSGSLVVERNSAGVESYAGRWWTDDGRQVYRKLGKKRPPGTSEGLTRTGAERALAKAMASAATPRPRERLTLSEVGEIYLHHLETRKGRKKATVGDYRIILHRHLAGPQDVTPVRGRRSPLSRPFFEGKRLDQIKTEDVDDFIDQKQREGLRASTIDNQINFLHGVFVFAIRKKWATSNPVAGVEHPHENRTKETRFLDVAELEAVLRAVADDPLGSTDRALYLAAGMTGLRRGELLALRWRDVDWASGVVRVRRSYSRGELGTPKTDRSSRAVPMADRVAAELERHFQRSAFTADDDLVFPHPQRGTFYDESSVLTRFKATLVRACVRDVRFHDLRHTFGTQMAAAGTPLRTLQAWMGHAEIQTTMRYADYAPDPSGGREWAERAFAARTECVALVQSEAQDATPENDKTLADAGVL